MAFDRSKLTDAEYRDRMDMPVECLAVAIFGVDGDEQLSDVDIVETAIRKINMLKSMVLATGVHKNLLDAAMKG